MECRGEERQTFSRLHLVGFSAAPLHFIMDLWSKKVRGIITQVALMLFSSFGVARGGEYSENFILGDSRNLMWSFGTAALQFTFISNVDSSYRYFYELNNANETFREASGFRKHAQQYLFIDFFSCILCTDFRASHRNGAMGASVATMWVGKLNEKHLPPP